jgi:hypothetical protein
MKGSFLFWASAVMVVLLVLSRTTEFFADFQTGVSIGIGAVVLVLYPVVLRGHEKRLAALEQRTGAGGRG